MTTNSVTGFSPNVHHKPVKTAETSREDIRLSSLEWRKKAADRLFYAGLARQSNDLISCSDPARAWQVLTCPDDSSHFEQIIVPSCKLSYCPICAHARSAELARNYTPVVQDALNASPDNYELRHVVLTTPYALTHSKIDKLTKTIWSKVVYCFETLWGLRQKHWKLFDFGLMGGWEFGEDGHKLHWHGMALCPFIDIERLKDCRKEANGGTCQVVYVRRVNGVEKGVKEVTKYATKLTALPPHLVPALHHVLSSKRRIRAYGAFSWKIVKQAAQPYCCPTCGHALTLLPLLHSKLGNNFSTPSGDNTGKVPQTTTRPPPHEHLVPLFDYPKRTAATTYTQ